MVLDLLDNVYLDDYVFDVAEYVSVIQSIYIFCLSILQTKYLNCVLSSTTVHSGSLNLKLEAIHLDCSFKYTIMFVHILSNL